MKKYAELILPFPIEGSFTYNTMNGLCVGQRVVVQFGMKKQYTAIVIELHNRTPKHYKTKPILSVLDTSPLVNNIQIEFWKWMSSYYICHLGDVMNTALPSSLKLASETKIQLSPDIDTISLTEEESDIISFLSDRKSTNMQDIISYFNKDNLFQIINKLIRKDILVLKEMLKQKYQKKILKSIDIINNNFDISILDNAPKQKEFLLEFQKLKQSHPNKDWNISELLEKINVSRSSVNSLITKNIIKSENKDVSRLVISNIEKSSSKKLSVQQLKAFRDIKSVFKEKDVCLLHGVTSSGKTEIYIKLIEESLLANKQVLYLLPEIALTTQIINRLKRCFGNKVGIFHSRISNAKQVEIWDAVKDKNGKNINYPIVIGARSALFLPFDNLGLVIIDEEHDTSYKQQSPNPKYNARDSAIYLSKLHKAKVILGSATPSLESYFNANTGKYSLVNLTERYGEIELPEIHCVDIKKANLKKEMVFSFSPLLLDSIKETLSNNKQIILFQNRRGYSPIISCSSCGFTPKCDFCDVSLTFHKGNNQIRCHYCGESQHIPNTCSSCNETEFLSKGLGTEQIEEQLKSVFSDIVCKRMDYDTTRKKDSYENIISDFEQGIIDVLVGTQMITKGLDFDNVALVGVLNADSMLNFPDFRSYERAFQLMMQVAGRAGRKKSQGKVIIQTFSQDHTVIKFLLGHNYQSFYNQQIIERELFNYPPYTRLISITLKHKISHILDKAADVFAVLMRKSFKDCVLGPEYPMISRIRNYYQKNILLKINLETMSLHKSKDIIKRYMIQLTRNINFRSIRIDIDVDPF